METENKEKVFSGIRVFIADDTTLSLYVCAKDDCPAGTRGYKDGPFAEYVKEKEELNLLAFKEEERATKIEEWISKYTGAKDKGTDFLFCFLPSYFGPHTGAFNLIESMLESPLCKDCEDGPAHKCLKQTDCAFQKETKLSPFYANEGVGGKSSDMAIFGADGDIYYMLWALASLAKVDGIPSWVQANLKDNMFFCFEYQRGLEEYMPSRLLERIIKQ